MLPDDQFDANKWAEMLEWGEVDDEFGELIHEFNVARDESPKLTRAQRYEIWNRVWQASEAEPMINLSTINYITAGWATAVVATMIVIAFLAPSMGFNQTEIANRSQSEETILPVETMLAVIPDIEAMPMEASSFEATQIARWGATPCFNSPVYWRNNTAEWPVETLVLGDEAFTRVEMMIILQEPVLGDLTYLLAQQLIAAEFNMVRAADDLAAVPAIAEAHQWLIVNPVGSAPSAVDRQEGLTLIRELEQFNTADLAGMGCSE